jgi:hypothetical protein
VSQRATGIPEIQHLHILAILLIKAIEDSKNSSINLGVDSLDRSYERVDQELGVGINAVGLNVSSFGSHFERIKARDKFARRLRTLKAF